MTNFLRHVQWGICYKKGLLMGNVCSIIFFFASHTVTDWIQEILLPMSFKWWWFLAFSEILLFGVYGVIWYQPIIDAHQLKNGQKPQLLWIYFELHNGVQKGIRTIFYVTSCLFCINWVITTSFYQKLNLLSKIFKISPRHFRISLL